MGCMSSNTIQGHGKRLVRKKNLFDLMKLFFGVFTGRRCDKLRHEQASK